MSDALVGLLLLSIAVLSPWLTWRFVHWSGVEAGAALHNEMAATPVPAAARGTVQTGKYAAQSAATSALIGAATGGAGSGAAAAAAARPQPASHSPAAAPMNAGGA